MPSTPRLRTRARRRASHQLRGLWPSCGEQQSICLLSFYLPIYLSICLYLEMPSTPRLRTRARRRASHQLRGLWPSCGEQQSIYLLYIVLSTYLPIYLSICLYLERPSTRHLGTRTRRMSRDRPHGLFGLPAVSNNLLSTYLSIYLAIYLSICLPVYT